MILYHLNIKMTEFIKVIYYYWKAQTRTIVKNKVSKLNNEKIIN